MGQSETYVPGMVGSSKHYEEFGNVESTLNTSTIASVEKKITGTKPVVGFLYSISSGKTEYWPLFVGTNIIGRGANCDVRLNEMTVSHEHASLVVRKMRTTGKVIASIKDLGSDVGMFLNDEELDFESHTCKNEDVIVVGSNYKLVLVLIDAEKYGLGVAEGFIAADAEENDEKENENESPAFDNNRTVGPNPYRRAADNTVALNGERAFTPNSTEILEINNK